jgi:hypothetical protein
VAYTLTVPRGQRVTQIRWYPPASIIAAGFPMLVYLRTLCPTVHLSADNASLATAAYTLGIVHANGYPTYLLLANVFTWIPVGEVAYRVNLMSAVFGAATIALLYHLCWRIVSDRLAALIAALTLAYSYFFWSASVVAEVYTLHTFFFTLIFALLFAWRESGKLWQLNAAALLFGLSLGNHLATVLLLPGFLALILARRSLLTMSSLVRVMVLLSLGLVVYVYLPVRYISGAPFNLYGWIDATGHFVPLDLTSFDGLYSVITAKSFRGQMFAYSPVEMVAQFGYVFHQLIGNFLGVGFIIGALGVYRSLSRGYPTVALFLLFLPHLAFFSSYDAPDKETMFLPTYVSWTLWTAIGIADLRQTAARVFGGFGRTLLVVTLLLMPLSALVVNYQRADVSGDLRARVWSESTLDSLEPDAYVIGNWAEATLLWYLQATEDRRPDVRVIHRGQISDSALRRLVDARMEFDPIYFIHPESGWDDSHRFIANGDLYRVLPRGGEP